MFGGYIKADTETKVVIGPVVAVADGFTPVTNLAISTADEAEILKHDAASVLDIAAYTFAAIANADGYYNLTIAAAALDIEGRITVLINDDNLCLPVRADFEVVNANIYDSMFAAATTDYLDVNVLTQANIDFGALQKASITAAANDSLVAHNLDHIALTATAAADMTSEVADGTILSRLLAAGDTSNFVGSTHSLKVIKEAIIASAPVATAATGNAQTTGTLIGGTYADTTTNDDSTYWITAPVTPAVGGFGLAVRLTTAIGVGRIATSVTVNGNFNAGGIRAVEVWYYDYNLAMFVQVSNSSNRFLNSASDSNHIFSLPVSARQVSDGAMIIRFTSTSVITTDRLNIDFFSVASEAQAASGLTSDAIQAAVWARSNEGHDNLTIGHTVTSIHAVDATVSSATSGTQFIINAGTATNDAYNGMSIELDDITDDHRETRRIVDYIGATKEVFVDRAFSFTPAAGDHAHIIGAGYSDVNVTHIAGTTQTANDNGADINDILADSNELQTDWADGGRLDLIQDIIAADTTTDIPALIADVPTVSEFNARTVLTASYFDPVNDTVANVTTVGTCTTNTDMRGTNNAALASICTEVRLAELDAANLITDVANVKVDTAAVKVKTDSLPSGIAKNVALSAFTFYMALTSDHVSAAAGKTIVGAISKDGAAFASLTNSISEISNGMYKVDITQAEMNADAVALKFTGTDCDQRVVVIYTT